MSDIKVKISKEPDIKVYIDGTRGDTAPGVYAPVEHNHEIGQVNGLQDVLNDKSDVGHNHDDIYFTEAETNTLLDGKANTEHSHDISDTTGLQTALDGKSNVVHTHDDRYYTETETDALLTNKANSAHNHAIVDVTGLQTALDGKSATGHNHNDIYFTEAEVTTLLTGKSNVGHGHNISNVAGLQTALDDKASTVHNHNDVYFTEAEVTALLTGKSNVGHNHNDIYYTEDEVNTLLASKAASSHTHDDIYFTEAEVNTLLAGKANNSHNHAIADVTGLQTALDDKQPTLVSGINISTINGQSLLAGGDIVISGGSGGTSTPAIQDVFSATEGQTVFTLSSGAANSIAIVSLNGLIQKINSDYTISGTTLTFSYTLTLNDEVIVIHGLGTTGSGGAAVEDQIVNDVTDKAPSQNAVFDALAGKADDVHTHDDLYYTETETNTLLAGKASTSHNHTIADVTGLQTSLDGKSDDVHTHDDLYYTETEINTLLAGKASTSHNHAIADVTGLQTALDCKADDVHTHDDLYYTETETNTLLAGKQDTLVSGTNIKTINGQSIIGSGDIVISGGSGGSSYPAIQDVFTATDGQTVFTLSASATGVSIVTLNGVQMKPTTDYTISGTELTFTFGLQVNDNVIVTHGFGGASSDLNSLIDVSLRAPEEGQVLKFDGTNWVNVADNAGSGDTGLGFEWNNPNSFQVRLIPKFGGGDYVAEGLSWNLTLTSKHYKTALLNLYNVVDTPYGRIGGALFGTADSASTTPYQGGGNHGVATGNGGYRFQFIGGLDRISDRTKLKSFIGLVTGNSGGTSGINAIGTNSITEFNTAAAIPHGFIGIGFYATDENLRIIMKRNGLQQPTYILLNSDFPVQSYTHYKLEIIKTAGSSNIIQLNLTNLLTGAVSNHTLVDDTALNFTTLPTLSTELTPVLYIGPGIASPVGTQHNISIVRINMICGYTG